MMPCDPGGQAVGRHLGEGRVRGGFPAIERQLDYPLSRLTTAVNELSRLAQTHVSDAIADIFADIDNGGYTSAGIEAAHKLRLWQADYLRLAAELDAGIRSFRLIEQGLRRQIDAALADWERRFEAARAEPEAARFSGPGPAAMVLGRRGRLRGLLNRGRAPAPPAIGQRDASPEPPEPAFDPAIEDESLALSPEADSADIIALVLGPLELTVAGERVERWTSLKARAIFQYLLIHRDRPVRRDVLMALEWPEHSYNSARNNLNVALCSLRNTLGWTRLDEQAILHKEGCYFLNPELTCWIDRNEFLSNIREAKLAREADDPHQAIKACRSAVELYRGPLFEDDPGAEWYVPERRQLKELYLQALEYVAAAYCERGQLVAAIEFGQRAVSADPCYEPGHRLLMRCYARQHQQQLVCRQYRLCTAALHDELDVTPDAETVQLFHSLTSAGSSPQPGRPDFMR